MLGRQTYLDALRPDIEEFIDIVRTGDLESMVQFCPGWDLRELGRHVGMIHRWA